ncbi:LacI family DNA-binding transcriptional regulator [Psychrobacillus soli]|uniref:LacI family transcriptional regulator n=1 Tax=Psychrobacillus soli TaxID=1543965 RepID=A0A544TLC5_9BACI|nr:LacI family DNA-binding transcriptional regulator [Psychrobacillus soli]TQR18254.1 LacI family transcriptional regulator [Psychrobacillus soli]
MNKVTMADVAQKAGVSKSTVSQFINNRFQYMADSTQERIRDVINELGYIPNFTAKSLKQKKSATIGVIVANILHNFSTEIIRSIEDECGFNNFHLFVCNADDDPDKERDYIDMLVAKQVDGLIIFPTNGNVDLYQRLKLANFPIIFVDRKIDEPLYPTILLDNKKAAELAVESILQKNRKDIALVATSIIRNVTPRVERINGFKEALLDNGIEPNLDWIIAVDRENIKSQLEKVWSSNIRPKAFFATNDLSLIELLKFIRENNIQIPQDVSVIAIDDSPFLEISNPPVTVIKQPTFEMGKEAVRKLLLLMTEESLENTYDIKRYAPTLIERKSL